MLRDRGLSLEAIAATLNSEGVPTPRGGARWRPSSVQSALGYRRPRPPAPGAPPPPPRHHRPPSPPAPSRSAVTTSAVTVRRHHHAHDRPDPELRGLRRLRVDGSGERLHSRPQRGDAAVFRLCRRRALDELSARHPRRHRRERGRLADRLRARSERSAGPNTGRPSAAQPLAAIAGRSGVTRRVSLPGCSRWPARSSPCRPARAACPSPRSSR